MSLIPAAQAKAREFMSTVAGEALTYRILSGTRTFAEQDTLFKKRPKVTNARGGESTHNFGIAWDIGIFDKGKFFTGKTKKEETAYEALGALIKEKVQGLEWGGDWKSFKDKPHFQLATGNLLSNFARYWKKESHLPEIPGTANRLACAGEAREANLKARQEKAPAGEERRGLLASEGA